MKWKAVGSVALFGLGMMGLLVFSLWGVDTPLPSGQRTQAKQASQLETQLQQQQQQVMEQLLLQQLQLNQQLFDRTLQIHREAEDAVSQAIRDQSLHQSVAISGGRVLETHPGHFVIESNKGVRYTVPR